MFDRHVTDANDSDGDEEHIKMSKSWLLLFFKTYTQHESTTSQTTHTSHLDDDNVVHLLLIISHTCPPTCLRPPTKSTRTLSVSSYPQPTPSHCPPVTPSSSPYPSAKPRSKRWTPKSSSASSTISNTSHPAIWTHTSTPPSTGLSAGSTRCHTQTWACGSGPHVPGL
jgi:hypothetical protein